MAGKLVEAWPIWFGILRYGFAVLQAPLFDGLSLDPFSLEQDCLAASEVDIGRGEVVQAREPSGDDVTGEVIDPVDR